MMIEWKMNTLKKKGKKKLENQMKVVNVLKLDVLGHLVTLSWRWGLG